MGAIALGIAGAAIGGASAASKGSGKNVIQRVTKNPALEKFNLGSQQDYATTRALSAEGLDEYIRNFLSGNQTATANTGQETAAIDRYYNGDVDRALAELRTKHASASDLALQRALGYATRSQNLDRIAGGGGDSSYSRQLAMRTGTDLNLNALLQNLAQERVDQEYVRQNQLGLAGRRTAMDDALAARSLVPGTARKSELGWNLGAIQSLLANDQANNIYGVKYKPGTFESIMNGISGAFNGFVGAGAGGVMGGMGGGDKSSASSGGTTWSAPNQYTNPGAPGYVTPLPAYSGGWGAGSSPYLPTTGGYTMPPLGETYSTIGGGWGAPLSYGGGWG